MKNNKLNGKKIEKINMLHIINFFPLFYVRLFSFKVNFNEPLSTLQRLTEEYEYSDLLDKAAECSDSCEQMSYVAAYTVSAYATTSNRTGKPFNPLLGETYECDRTDDFGWRCLSEQVNCYFRSNTFIRYVMMII